MRILSQKIQGSLIETPTGNALLWWRKRDVEQYGVSSLNGAAPLTVGTHYLRYALTIRGPETLIFPSSLIDDWGNDTSKLSIYAWLRKNGDFQPRSEVFGVDALGQETQHFVREVELHYKYPLFIAPERSTSPLEHKPIMAVILFDSSAETPTKTTRPADLKGPLRRAAVSWWHASAEQILNATTHPFFI